jgi:hypothetical protein
VYFLHSHSDIVNEKQGYLPYTEFYNDLLNEQLDLQEDFVHWKREEGFSYCNYSFILDPRTKSRVLHIESAVQQHRERMEAMNSLFTKGVVSSPALVLRVRREHLIEDTLRELSHHPPEDLRKELRVQFVGEEAIDEGGVKKEWFQLLVREIFDPKYGMYHYNSDSRTYWFNSHSMDVLEFQLIGMVRTTPHTPLTILHSYWRLLFTMV